MELHRAIEAGDFESFCKALKDGADLRSTDWSGGTVLHCLARKKEENSSKAYFSKKVKLHEDYFAEIRCCLTGLGVGVAEFVVTQDESGNTPVHIAIENENWGFAELLGRYAGYTYRYGELRKRNRCGLTELEYALILYGAKGGQSQIRDIFGVDRGCSESLDYWVGLLKSASKAFKIIKLPKYKGGNYFLGHDHAVFEGAVEDDYPSEFSVVEDDDLIRIYGELGVSNHGVSPKEKEVRWPRVSVDTLISRSKIHMDDDGKEDFRGFLCELLAYVYSCGLHENLANLIVLAASDLSLISIMKKRERDILVALISRFRSELPYGLSCKYDFFLNRVEISCRMAL